MTSLPNITTITPPRVPFVDPRTGLISREWYRFLLNLFTRSLDVDGSLLAPTGSATSAQLDTLAAQVQALEQANSSAQSQLAVIESALQSLALTPQTTPQLVQRRYGSFYDTTTQTASLTNTAYGIKYNTTDLSMGVTIGSPTSRVYVDRAGIYDIQFSAQMDNTSGGDHLIWIWLRVNGTDVPYSASELRIKGNDAELVAAWNFLYNFKDGDYFELMWAVDDTGVQIKTVGAVAPVPAIPSVILTVMDNIING